ncbi:hypothetical protein N7478_008987 [Penicillium angulare]|uniref:uncharacterized protein n=1 Tax=Penicillium angulare TaxID=116970 RepID=UPI002540527E|nr:uncharacterized protein N7478_008987 [Penicillium angulare]KAJ5273862.1 hypothetical protein N7478_008987 [Penicillium angulare]
MQPRMCYDDATWEESEEFADTWVRKFFNPDISTPIGNFLSGHQNPGDAISFDILGKSYFHIALWMIYETGPAGVIRIPLPGAIMFPEEEQRYEVAIMRYPYDQTSIRVPFIYQQGSKRSRPLELGPYIILSHLKHQRNNAIHSADDCRRKFIARFLFRKLAQKCQLTQRWEASIKAPSKSGAMISPR